MEIGKKIKKLRLENGITQGQLAAYINVSLQTVSRWETGVTYPDIVMLPILAKHFHVTVDYLLGIGGKTMKTIESMDFLIREWSENDAKALFELKEENAGFLSYLKFKTVNDSLDIIKIWKEYKEMYPLVFKETQKIVGVVGVVDIDRYKGYKELEVHIGDEFNSVDYQTQAHSLILNHAFNEQDLLVACAYCGGDVEPLKKAMLNTGFVYEGTLRKFGRNMSDVMRFSLVKEEFVSKLN